MNRRQPITILIAALGGEGGGVLAEWLVEIATRAGHPAQATSIPGVAQRTGATTYYVEIHPQTRVELGGRTPVLSLAPVPGCVDLMVASELLEAVRAIQNGFVSPERTALLASSQRTLTTFEKLAPGDGRFDSERLLQVAAANSRQLATFDVAAAAREAGTVPSAVLCGAIAGSGVLPFARAAFEDVIRTSGRGVEASLRGFALGFERCTAAVSVGPTSVGQGVDGVVEVDGGLKSALQHPDLIAQGHARVVEFQDAAYGELYRQRVERLRAAEQLADPQGRHGAELAREGARFLALWMAFDDVIRVADLKSRASRFARVRAEAGAAAGDLLRIADHFKPGVTELAGLLPPSTGRRLLAWESRRRRAGKAPLGIALKLRADSISGFLALRLLAGLRPLRRRGQRYAEEQALIERWLAAVEQAAARDWQAGFELALCARLVKGYGATNERAKDNLRHIVEHLAHKDAADIGRARTAALADEAGSGLDQVLLQTGAPQRAVKPVPVRWFKRQASRP
ncbi:indolepyruvate oxidoreductase subunit beta family protein [Sulfuritalea sp.]|uniref:indolepyruvate oxidoreductase subunit beta family protein n=1 Tax=Sulfuritalea sp. TaxID=2480090 RepID=UPI00286E7CEC|nr:indolepyruvate oxidoreductase subunit beta family protein [Sulfuritalea sp.]